MGGLMFAARYGMTYICQLLIECGADPKIQTKFGDTPLIWAVYNQHLETTDKLLEFEAGPNIQDNQGETALIKAAFKGNTAIARDLLHYGYPGQRADLNH
jgi:hypothetical protein